MVVNVIHNDASHMAIDCHCIRRNVVVQILNGILQDDRAQTNTVDHGSRNKNKIHVSSLQVFEHAPRQNTSFTFVTLPPVAELSRSATSKFKVLSTWYPKAACEPF